MSDQSQGSSWYRRRGKQPPEETRPSCYVCTAAAPWTPEKGRSIHPDAVSLGDTDYGRGENCADYRCPHCGLYFEVELPQ